MKLRQQILQLFEEKKWDDLPNLIKTNVSKLFEFKLC